MSTAYDELKEAYECRESLIASLRDEVARLTADLARRPAPSGDTVTVPSAVEAAIIEYSFGSEQAASATRTWAIRALAAKTSPEDVVAQITRGREWYN